MGFKRQLAQTQNAAALRQDQANDKKLALSNPENHLKRRMSAVVNKATLINSRYATALGPFSDIAANQF
jgi:hypothetical protein